MERILTEKEILRKGLTEPPKQKKDNTSIYYKDWTTKKLKSEAKAYHQLIYGNICCYGTKDLMHYDGILNELSKRGVELNTQLVF